MRLVEWFYPKKLSKTKKIIFDLCRGCGPTSLTAEAEDFMAFKNTSQFCLRWWILSFSMSFPHIFESAFTSLCQFWPKFLTFRSNKHIGNFSTKHVLTSKNPEIQNSLFELKSRKNVKCRLHKKKFHFSPKKNRQHKRAMEQKK